MKTGSMMASDAMRHITNLSPDQVNDAILGGDITMIDLREHEELARDGTIRDAVHIPRGLLEFVADPGSPLFNPRLAPENNLILFCASGLRSALAVETLADMGFPTVSHLAGGFKSWVAQGFPVDHASFSSAEQGGNS